VACSSRLAALVGHEMPSKYTKAALGARAKASLPRSELAKPAASRADHH
jgi:hypothetical protein